MKLANPLRGVVYALPAGILLWLLIILTLTSCAPQVFQEQGVP